MKDKVYYTIENNNNHWVVWLNVEKEHSCYCRGLFAGSVRQCVKYAKENKLRIKGGTRNLADKIPTWREVLMKSGNISN